MGLDDELNILALKMFAKLGAQCIQSHFMGFGEDLSILPLQMTK